MRFRGVAIFLLSICILMSFPAVSFGSRKVVASFLPVYIFARNVLGDRAELKLLIAPSADIHDFYLRPADIKNLQEADIIFINGASLEVFTEKIGKGKTSDTSRGVELIKKGRITDPHIWLDPLNAIRQVRNIRDAMIKIDPAGRVFYEKNAEIYIKRLETLDKEIKGKLSKLRKRHLITYHEAFNYFARRYGLTPHSVTGLEAEHAGPGSLRAIYDIVRKENIGSIFIEKGFPEQSLKRLKEDLGVGICELNTIETGSMDGKYYESAMRENLEAIIRCMGGVN